MKIPEFIITTRDEEKISIRCEEQTTLMEAILGAGVAELVAMCGGNCSCATCHVYIDEAFSDRLPPMSEDEEALLDCSDHRTEQSRLSCQIPITDALEGMQVVVAPED